MASTIALVVCVVVSLVSTANAQWCPDPAAAYNPNDVATYPYSIKATPLTSSPDIATNPISDATFNPASPVLKKYIIDKHNCLRTLVSPLASNMQELTWNDQLATLAQTLANKCTGLTHDSGLQGAAGTTCTSTVGQNIFASPNNFYYTWKYGIDRWFNERDTCTNGQATSCNGVSGHYTQVAWAKSNQIGCGFSKCSGTDAVFVCNYCTAGNFNNEQPYVAGTPCTACPTGTTCDPKGQLCLANGVPPNVPGPAVQVTPAPTPAPTPTPTPTDPNAPVGRPNGYDRCDLTFCKGKANDYFDPQPCSRNYCKCSGSGTAYQMYSCAAGKYFTKVGGVPQCKAPDATFCPTKTAPNPLPAQSPWPVTAPASLSKFCNAQNCADRASFKYYPLDKCSPYRCHCDPVRVVVCPDGQYWDFRSEIEQCTSKYLLPYCNGNEF